MLGNFTYSNPTRLHFGENSLEALHEELSKYKIKVQLIYGSGSIKRNGIYDQVVEILKTAEKPLLRMQVSCQTLPCKS